MEQKPLVGVMPLYDEEKESIWMLPGYLNCIQQAGAIPLTVPPSLDSEERKQVLTLCDGLLFTGGHDVNPQLYGERKHPATVFCRQRDELERELFRDAYDRDLPMLGICRGIQLFNVLMGGTLYQDLPTQYCSGISHQMAKPYDRGWHCVTLSEGTPLAQTLGKQTLDVNSYHHQAVKQLADGLCEMARSEDGLAEAVYDPSRTFLWAVQWHPEFCFHNNIDAQKIVGAFVRACGKKLL